MGKAKKGRCRLCLKETKLIKSHIIPEPFYKHIYGNGPRKMIAMSSDSSRKIKLHQKGMREHLMCRKCDGDIVGQYDKYISELFFRHAEPGIDQVRTIRLSVNYRMFRLFQLSLLWRFHIAESSSFDAVNLGDHADVIRKMVLDGDPGEANFYPCVMIWPHDIFTTLAGGIFCPVATGTPELPMCRIMLAGLVWIWFMVPDASGHLFLDTCVKDNGAMQIIKGPPELTERIKQELVEMNLATGKAPNAHKLSDWGFG
jgi:hypothetical protein